MARQTQSEDGRWDASRFGAGIERAVLGQDRGGAGADADSGITALALLAFLGAGHSHTEGDYQTTVAKGLEFLMRGQSADGHLASETSLYAQMYCHSMATFALAEALAMTGDNGSSRRCGGRSIIRCGRSIRRRAVGDIDRATRATRANWVGS